MTFVSGVCYDPQRAKESVHQVKDILTTIEGILKKDAISEGQAQEAYKMYETLPITYQINWSVANEDPCENQKKADFCGREREKNIEIQLKKMTDFKIIDDAMGYARLYGFIEVEKQTTIQKSLIEKYEKEADIYWDKFYKKNKSNFFKDRHWLVREFSEFLKNSDKETLPQNRIDVFEIGCGVGNTCLPLMELNKNLNFTSFDFSEYAVKLLAEQVESNDLFKDRCKTFVYNASKFGNPDHPLPSYIHPNQCDLVVIIFVISAMDPTTFQQVVDMCHYVLKPGGMVLIRDYAVEDMAQSRFENSHHPLSKISDNFHVRYDGTRAYYFSLDEMNSLFCGTNKFKNHQNIYIEKKVTNRKQNSEMDRKFIQSKFIKL
ncbi:hypothetical protein DLAC_01570 [Tieghemostelium lacteum]|uniref:Methyltransferase type 12 domain-containing protein n=1 Tax=Tieghemostelium lacteum TaxID=361077 RepID=A0A152A5R4_TIELA|nr:hypothetical protein DLAC_01570 [Tieghemostelium lacteum]|eukprot:KYR01573.1 hypothetical protein DLAC_01570 [Tieghemostelium lacteum]